MTFALSERRATNCAMRAVDHVLLDVSYLISVLVRAHFDNYRTFALRGLLS